MKLREIARSNDLTANPPERKAGTAAPRPWEFKQYIYQEPRDDPRSSHNDPRLESAQHMHRLQLDEHDNDFIPSDDDGDHGYGSFVFSTTPNLDACDPSASDKGTLAGGLGYSKLTSKIQNWAGRDQRREQRRALTELQAQIRGMRLEIQRRLAMSEGQRR
jgi:hypothetical protein